MRLVRSVDGARNRHTLETYTGIGTGTGDTTGSLTFGLLYSSAEPTGFARAPVRRLGDPRASVYRVSYLTLHRHRVAVLECVVRVSPVLLLGPSDCLGGAD